MPCPARAARADRATTGAPDRALSPLRGFERSPSREAHVRDRPTPAACLEMREPRLPRHTQAAGPRVATAGSTAVPFSYAAPPATARLVLWTRSSGPAAACAEP